MKGRVQGFKGSRVQENTIDFNLYLITDRKQIPPYPPFAKGGWRGLTDIIESALKGGVKAIQLREKDLSGKELFELAKKLRILTRKYNTKLFINDRVDIALAVEADGVHLGQSSLSPADVRRVLHSSFLIGVSTHSLEEARLAEEDGADFITLGPIFHTPSKAIYGEPIGVDTIKKVKGKVRVPVLAIGGIKREDIREVLEAGADGVAVISAIMGADDPKEATRSLITEVSKVRVSKGQRKCQRVKVS